MRVKKLLIKVELENGAECNFVEYQAFSLVINGTPYIVNAEFDTIDMQRVFRILSGREIWPARDSWARHPPKWGIYT